MIGYGQQPQGMYGMNNPQMQNGALISVRNEYEARNYPTAHGASLTFKDENAPYLYTKTLGFSQMDVPVFERFRLVKEEDVSGESDPRPTEGNDHLNELKQDISQLQGQIRDIKRDVDGLLSFRAEFGGDENA